MTITVYLDMDGVLADFDKKVSEIFGKNLKSFSTSAEAWLAIDNHIPDIYSLLEKKEDADVLVDGVFDLQSIHNYNFGIGILTGIPRLTSIPNAKRHKREWILKHYPELIFDFNIGPYSQHKQYHARAGDVLIDDNEKNIDQWAKMGGYGILHVTASNSLDVLNKYLLRYFD